MLALFTAIFLMFSGISEAGELWTKYDLPDTINCITNSGDYIWMGTENGIVRMNRNNGSVTRFTTETDSLAENYLNYIVSDKNGNIFAGSQDSKINGVVSGGISLYNGESWKSFKKDINGLAGIDICGLSVDNDNNVWVALNDHYSIGSKNEGTLIYYARQAIQYFQDSQWQTQIINTQSQKWWDGNFHWEPNDINPGSFDVIDSGFIAYVNYSGMGNLGNLNVIDVTTNSKNTELIDGNPFVTIEKSENSKIKVWIKEILPHYEIRFGEYEIDTETRKLNNLNNWQILSSLLSGFSHENSVQIKIDNSHNKWFIDRDEFNNKYLIKYNDTNYVSYTCPDWTPSTEITCLYPDDKGFIWIGTQSDGLFRFDAKNATAVESAQQSPTEFTISSPYPNPFNAQTTISFTLTKPGKVNLSIYSLTGQKVREIGAGSYSEGKHTAVWDGKNEKGEIVSSGLYLARMDSGGVSKVVRMAMVK